MAVKTVTNNRIRTELKVFTEASLGDLVTAYNTEEVSLAADATKTWTLQPISFFHDGTDFNLIAYAYYPEQETDPLGQLPTPP
jgi:hypothetical protein